LENKLENIKNSIDYDNYLRTHVKYFIVTTFKGRGKYEKVAFDILEDAIKYRDLIKSKNETALVYGLSQPPHTIQTVSIAMEV
tara:strand:- start:62 stop:310 length:249 start_codon:yes stop_codon:yes gene_type:complete